MEERFSYLLTLYLEKNIPPRDKTEFFELLSTGNFDDILEKRFDKTMYEDDAQAGTDLPPYIAREIFDQILASEKKVMVKSNSKKMAAPALKWLAAASVVAVIAVSFYFFNNNPSSSHLFISQFIENSPQKTINTTDSTLPVVLPDGSRIVLEPRSSVFYSLNTFAVRREVYVEGEAFFDIAKNPLKPFYVYYDDLVTKVLGTSFSIRTNSVSGNIEVEVLTGKVQVYENEAIVQRGQKNMSLIITPNQKAIYKISRHFFETTLVDSPVVIAPARPGPASGKEAMALDFVFENVQLSQVLKELETVYGIEIVVSNEDIYQCVFSGDVSRQNLYDKLKIICLATNADYEINGTRILIKGNGCP